MSKHARNENRRRRRLMYDIDVGVARLLTAGHTAPVPERVTAAWELPPPGVHLWAMYGMWRIDHPEDAFDSAKPKFLDLENLLTITGPGCVVCEQVWTADIAARPCPGDPSNG